jgi:hypothetical protein
VNSLFDILRARREDIERRWLAAASELVDDEYREMLQSPLGMRLLRRILDDLADYQAAEEYQASAVLRRIEEASAAEARHRVTVGFALADILAALQAIRTAVWEVLIDAVAEGRLPPLGQVMAEMKELDELLDCIVRAEVAGSLAARHPASDA